MTYCVLGLSEIPFADFKSLRSVCLRTQTGDVPRIVEGFQCIRDYINFRLTLPPLAFTLTYEVDHPHRHYVNSPPTLFHYSILETPFLRLAQLDSRTTLHIRLLFGNVPEIFDTKEKDRIRSELPELNRLGLLTISEEELSIWIQNWGGLEVDI